MFVWGSNGQKARFLQKEKSFLSRQDERMTVVEVTSVERPGHLNTYSSVLCGSVNGGVQTWHWHCGEVGRVLGRPRNRTPNVNKNPGGSVEAFGPNQGCLTGAWGILDGPLEKESYEGGPVLLYLSFSSCVTRLVMRPHSSPTRKSMHTPTVIISRM